MTKEIKINWKSEKTTCDMKMTKSQEKLLKMRLLKF